MEVIFGVDPHKDSLELAACDQLGQKLNSAEFPNTEDGSSDALEWIQGFEGKLLIGVEGSGYFGAVLTRRLVKAGPRPSSSSTFSEIVAALSFSSYVAWAPEARTTSKPFSRAPRLVAATQ